MQVVWTCVVELVRMRVWSCPSNKKQTAREAEADFRRALFRLHLPLKGCMTCVRPPLSLVLELSPELCCVFPDTSPTIQVRCP